MPALTFDNGPDPETSSLRRLRGRVAFENLIDEKPLATEDVVPEMDRPRRVQHRDVCGSAPGMRRELTRCASSGTGRYSINSSKKR